LTTPSVRARATSVTIARAVPLWVWLAAVVLLSAGLRIWFARRLVAPSVMVDELIYSELAKSFAASGHFLVRGEPSTGYGFVYPLLIAPAYRLFHSVPSAYMAAKAIGSVTMSLAAVPAYFLARRVLTKPLALTAAALSVAIPSMLYTGMLMTENAFYPIFLCVALVLVLMLERPTVVNQLGLLLLCLFAYETRQQALALFPAVLTAPLLLGRSGLARFRVLYAGVVGVVAAAVLAEAARGRSPVALLGAYETAGRHRYSLSSVAKWLLWHVAELDLYLGVVPVAAFLVLALSWRRLERRQRAFLAAASALSAWMIVEVAAFASLPSVKRVEERDLFYIAPFFLIALLLWIELGAPRPRRRSLLAATGSGALVGTLPFSKLIDVHATSDTLALVPWLKLQEHAITLHQVRLVATLCALGAGALFILVPSRLALVLPVLVFVYFAVAQRPIEDRAELVSRASLFAGIRSVRPDWIDQRVGSAADVAAIWTGRTQPYVVWENEFFNRSVGSVYDVGSALPGGLASTAVTVGRDGRLRDPAGRLLRHRFVLVDGSLDVDGVKVASDTALEVNLWKVSGPIRSLTRVDGLYPNDTWSGRVVVYHRLRCRGGSVRVTLLGDPQLFTSAQTVRAAGSSRLVRPGAPASITVPLTGCRARFTISPTKVPGSHDRRRLGIHFLSFEYLPPQ
jgi:hypothetical protein